MHKQNQHQSIIVTGGSGFIGSHFIRHVLSTTSHHIINIDALTYAGSSRNLIDIEENPNYSFEHHSVCNSAQMTRIFNQYQPNKIIHLAAESHVDRSISSASRFIDTNIKGTYVLLEACHTYWRSLDDPHKADFKFHHVSTDEVYGDLEEGKESFHEDTPYNPSSPYSASKAASDHLVRAWHRTYGLPNVISNCSNNYGPYQFPEKLIPVVIQNAINRRPIPVYGEGQQIRDWLHVGDHADALFNILMHAPVGQTYNIGAYNEQRNIDVVHMICKILNKLRPIEQDYKDLISFVEDRPGHDLRYAINSAKLERDLNWVAKTPFDIGLEDTVQWYLHNPDWVENILFEKNKEGEK